MKLSNDQFKTVYFIGILIAITSEIIFLNQRGNGISRIDIAFGGFAAGMCIIVLALSYRVKEINECSKGGTHDRK